MTELPTPIAARLPRPRWLDARLLLGLLLVLMSVAVGAKIFAEADQRVQVWSVTRDLGPRSTLAAGDLSVRSVRLDRATLRYVSAKERLVGLVLTRPVGRDELLPAAAVGRPDTVEQRRVVIEVDRFGATGLAKGRVVDVYSVRDTPSGTDPAKPDLVLTAVTVAEDVAAGGGFGGSGSRVGVTVYVDGPDVAKIIDAVAHGTVYLVQVPGSKDVRAALIAPGAS